MKKLFLSLPLSLLLFVSTTPVYAHPWKYHVSEQARAREAESIAQAANSTEMKARAEEVKAKIEEFKAASTERRLAAAKEVCTKMADHRITAVENIKTRVNASDLSEEQKDDILSKADEVLVDLNTYKTECSDATTVDAVRAVIAKIKAVNVFKWILPRANALRAINSAQAFIGRLTNHVETMQKHIDKAEAAGCDVTEAQEDLTNYQTAVQEAQTHLNESKNVVVSVGDTTDPGQAKREQVKEHIKLMVESLKKARDAHKGLIKELKECRTSQSDQENEQENETES